ncbi:Hsp20/alpha crystallin family protein [Marinobacter sp.]|uniref:Hsp20/alpha crystallin family protein n=1 Tax=Marinobacter sp. TaxID=50741 RepID=UPI00384CE43A
MNTLSRYRGSALAAFQDDLNRLMGLRGLPFQTEAGEEKDLVAWTPAVDIKEEEDSYVITADVPGVDPKEIEVTLDAGMLTIRGSRQEEKKTEEEGYQRLERFSGSFYRRFALPDATDPENVKAKATHGVLEIRVPREPAKAPKRINVES